jgi:hypothetical protein
MAYREVSVYEIKEVLRLWLRGEGYRAIDRLSGVDRKTVRRYIEAAVAAGLTRDGGEAQLTDVVIGLVCERVRPARPAGHGAGWESLLPHEAEIKAWVAKDLKLVKVQDLLARQGVVVVYRTLNRFATQRCGFGAAKTTVRVNDGEPGSELQVDFGRMGLLPDPATGRRRMVDALIFTACYSRHCFVWLSHRQTTAAVIDGFEAAWAFFGGYVGHRCQEASSARRSSRPSKIFCRPTWPLARASSRCRSSVGLNLMVVTKKVQDSQIDSKWQSISTGRAQ